MPGEHTNSPSCAPAPASRSDPADHKLVVGDSGVRTAFDLLIKTLPFAVARFAILAMWSTGCTLWVVAAISGAREFSARLDPAFGTAWLIACLVGAVWVWATALRRALQLLTCGHVAVLTALMTGGQAGYDRGSMLSRGEALVLHRFGRVNFLFGMNRMLRSDLRAFHASFDRVVRVTCERRAKSTSLLRFIAPFAVAGYLDKVILSYNFARRDGDPGAMMGEGFVYYAQNAGPILTSSVRIVLLEQASTLLLTLLLLASSGVVTLVLPDAMQIQGGIIAVLIAILVVAMLRSALIKPLFLIMMIVRFHTLVQDQAISQDWQASLASIPGTFGTMAPRFATPRGKE